MDEQFRIILIIIVSVSIFGLLVFVFVKNYVRNKINNLVEEEKDKETKAKSMIQRGNSISKIRNYLMGKGINSEFINDTVDRIKEDNSDQDFFSAIKICKKKRIGPARAEDNRTLFYKKDISLLARNGFDFETSRKVMDIEKDEYLKIINLL